FFTHCYCYLPYLLSFPTRRSSDLGGSERQIYCLPYGVCMEDTSISGTGGFVPAGQGIQELALGAYNADNTDVKVLIGTTTIADRDRKSTRLNSSHVKISYAVFCLK